MPQNSLKQWSQRIQPCYLWSVLLLLLVIMLSLAVAYCESHAVFKFLIRNDDEALSSSSSSFPRYLLKVNSDDIEDDDNNHNNKVPTLFPLKRRDAVTFVLAFLSLGLAAGGGIGGGGILVSLYILILKFPSNHAIPLSHVTILAGAIANVWLNAKKRHPDVDRPLIDWDLILIMEPLTLSGALLGAHLNVILPDLVVVFCLVLLLTVTGRKTLIKAIKLYQTEKQGWMYQTEKQGWMWWSQVETTTNYRDDNPKDAAVLELSIQNNNNNNNNPPVLKPPSLSSGPRCLSSPPGMAPILPSPEALAQARSLTEEVGVTQKDKHQAPENGSLVPVVKAKNLQGSILQKNDKDTWTTLPSSPRPRSSFGRRSIPKKRLNISLPNVDEENSTRITTTTNKMNSNNAATTYHSKDISDKDHSNNCDEEEDDKNKIDNNDESAILYMATVNLARYYDILEEERQPRLRTIAIISGMFLYILLINLIKGGGGIKSPLGIACASAMFWFLELLIVVMTIGVTLYARSYLIHKTRMKDRVGYEYLETDVRWDERSTWINPALCSGAGLVAGLCGVGGGLIKAPLMLSIGVHPAVASATSATMILFTTFTATTSFLIFGVLALDYAAACLIVGFVATFIGQTLMNALIRRTGRISYIAFSISAIVLISAMTMSAELILSLSNYQHEARRHHSMGGFCGPRQH